MQQQDSSEPTGVADLSVGRPANKGVATPVQVSRNRKAQAALQLRLANLTWEEIATSVGYPTARAAMVATERALVKELHEDTDSREHMREMAGARLNRLLRSVWPKAIDGEHPEHLLAASKAREIIDRHIKLYGLDAPTEVIVHTPTRTELEEWVTQVLALGGTTTQVSHDVILGTVVDEDDVSTG